MKDLIKVSVIVTTYNWPDALEKVMAGLAIQTYPHYEVIIADDGSRQETFYCISQAKSKYPMNIQHVWQPDEGFQAARIRNKAVAKARGDYLIFIDGDCVPLPHFIERHVKLAESGWLLAGNRILLSQGFTDYVIKSNIPIYNFNLREWFLLKKSNACNRITPLLYLPFFPRKLQASRWAGAKTCNLSLWKKDFIKVNGFDEAFIGWGHEDSDLVNRLLKLGIKRKEGRFALPIIHFWHCEQDRSLQKQNLARFYSRLTDQTIQATLGINQYTRGDHECPY